jgi:putative exosortase-associated protein (TIGR04073 family)
LEACTAAVFCDGDRELGLGCDQRSFSLDMEVRFKRLFVLLALGFLLCAGPQPASADDAWSKLGRGLSNLFFGWGELGAQPMRMAEHEPWPIAVLGGLFKGVAMTVVRMSAGVYETVSFMIPWPNGYGPILLPEFVVE